ncbi:MAG: DUF3667 domain-containing protein [Cyclobacteriaceae bacterium]|nr:DUF3667 domain-containing protein [Cyclobacteriaceae bacterium]
MMDELGKSMPISEGMIDAEQGVERKQPNEFCLNCRTKLLDTFCQHCGQKDIPQRQTLGELLTNFISSFWSYEGKFLKTIKFLVIKPGFLATEYNAGKRETYYHPARMYVFISFIFFLLLAVLPSDDLKKSMVNADFSDEEGRQETLSDSATSMVDSIKTVSKKNDNSDFTIIGNYKTRKSYDSAQALLPQEKQDGWLMKRLTLRSTEINERYKGKSKEFASDFRDAFFDNFSKVLFWLLPFFALLLKLFYVRRDYFYSEHLVFSIYYYNFFYFAGSLQVIVNTIPVLEWASTFIGFWIVLYLFFAMKRMYQQSLSKTITKYILFFFSFVVLMAIGFVVSALFIFLAI